MTIVASTSPIAASVIGRRFARRSREVGEERARVQQRRQEDHEHEVGLELDLGQAEGHKAITAPPITSTIGYGHVDRPGGGRQAGDGDQQRDEDQFDFVQP